MPIKSSSFPPCHSEIPLLPPNCTFNSFLFRFLTLLIVTRLLNDFKHLVFLASVKLSSQILKIFKAALQGAKVCFEQPPVEIAPCTLQASR